MVAWEIAARLVDLEFEVMMFMMVLIIVANIYFIALHVINNIIFKTKYEIDEESET